MVCSGDNVRFSAFVWPVVVTMSELVCLCGVLCTGDNVRSSVFVWCVVVTMSDLACLCYVYW